MGLCKCEVHLLAATLCLILIIFVKFLLQREKDGFKKSSRPSTANPNSATINERGEISRPNTGNPNFPEVDYYNNGYQQDLQQFENRGNTNTLNRPKTAGPVITYRGATPLFSGTDFNPERSVDPRAHSRPCTGKVPKFVELDKMVLRFYAHFFQDRNWDRDGPLGDPELEKEICRLVTVQYYLVDNEVQILEPKVTNAGTV